MRLNRGRVAQKVADSDPSLQCQLFGGSATARLPAIRRVSNSLGPLPSVVDVFGGRLHPKRSQTGFTKAARESLSRGFSVIELLLVVAVSITLAAIALPVVRPTVEGYQLRSAASTVAGIVQSTRYQAISQGCPYRVVFSQSAKTYQIQNDTSATCNASSFSNVGTAVPIGNSAVTIGADTTLQFGGGGTTKATTGTLTIVLTRSSRTATLVVSPFGSVNVTYQ